MLVLSRKIDQQIVISDNVFVTVLGISDGKVRLGIEAPREIPVHRREAFNAFLDRGDPVRPGTALPRDVPPVAPPDTGPDVPHAGYAGGRNGYGYPDGLGSEIWEGGTP